MFWMTFILWPKTLKIEILNYENYEIIFAMTTWFCFIGTTMQKDESISNFNIFCGQWYCKYYKIHRNMMNTYNAMVFGIFKIATYSLIITNGCWREKKIKKKKKFYSMMKKRNFFALFEVTTFIEFQIKHSHLHTPHSFSSFSLAMNNELISHHILSIQTKHRKFSMYTLHSYLVALHFLHLYCELQTLYSSDEKKSKEFKWHWLCST